MSGPFRLAEGGAVDRARPLRFRFDGRSYEGFAGDTLASALLANGVDLLARSFKLHRPRGVLSAGVEESHALVTVGEGARATPSVAATRVPLAEGLVARSQHAWPGVAFDLGALLGLGHALFPAGFYNKALFWPSFRLYEPALRRLAGLGTAPAARDPDRYAWRNAHCDLLVVGAGPAGLVAALTAARSGARVLLVESEPAPGGSLLDRREPLAGVPPRAWIASLASALAALPNARLLARATVVGAYDHGVFAALEELDGASSVGRRLRQRWWRIRARRALLATGAVEQPLVFADNDRPGVVLAGAARRYAHRYAVAAGRRVVVATNHDGAYRAALDLGAAGIEVPCLLDARPAVRDDLAGALAAAGIELRRGARVERALGWRRVRGVEIVTEPGGERATIRCDALAVSGGVAPALQLFGQAGGRLRFDPHRGAFLPDGEAGGSEAIGAAAGELEPRSALDRAAECAAAAVEALGFRAEIERAGWEAIAPEPEPTPVGPLGCASERRRDRAFVDFAHDVTAADLDLAVRENLTAIEHVKRYTTLGMALDQGKTSNLSAVAIVAARTGKSPAEVGTTRHRPPVVPVTLGAIAGGRLGRFLRPSRLLPTHDRQRALGAPSEEFGGWRRPVAYPRAGESEEPAVRREMVAVRTAAGIFDASPLGKILVRGRDAARFLEFVYATPVADLAPGRARYGLMLTEKGVILDDGVCARLAEEEFWVSTSSAHAVRIAAWLEEWRQCQFPDLAVVTTDLTSAWATIAVAGPRARAVVAALGVDGIDLAPAAFPHFAVQDGRIGETPCRIFRVSFTGEATYELNVPADSGAALWDALLAAGAPFGVVPFGVEALLRLRIEKGYFLVGADTDGTTIPDDVGFGPALARKTGDFVGRRSLALAEHRRDDRLQLVGLRCAGPERAFVAGAHLVDARRPRPPVVPAGYLTSACASPVLGARIGLGMLRRGRARKGEIVHLVSGDASSRAEVVPVTQVDPLGERLRG
jgi:sarcosine oxidase subunit alpha